MFSKLSSGLVSVATWHVIATSVPPSSRNWTRCSPSSILLLPLAPLLNIPVRDPSLSRNGEFMSASGITNAAVKNSATCPRAGSLQDTDGLPHLRFVLLAIGLESAYLHPEHFTHISCVSFRKSGNFRNPALAHAVSDHVVLLLCGEWLSLR